MALVRLHYISAATAAFKEKDITQILDNARRRNTAARITGVLLYKDRRFMQVIEGPAESISALLQLIKTDSRHTLLKVEEFDAVSERVFPDWSMGYIPLHEAGCEKHVVGYLDMGSKMALKLRLLHAPEETKRMLCEFIGIED